MIAGRAAVPVVASGRRSCCRTKAAAAARMLYNQRPSSDTSNSISHVSGMQAFHSIQHARDTSAYNHI
jgi:hypothetical protein